MSKKVWLRKQGGTTRWRGLNREGCSLLEEMSVIPPLFALSYMGYMKRSCHQVQSSEMKYAFSP